MANGNIETRRRNERVILIIDIKNELLHSKNIEAITNVLMSYENSYPGNSVSVLYDGDVFYCTGRFNNMFPLSWGRVRFGHQLVIELEGNGNGKIQDTLKLQKCLELAAGDDYAQFINPYSTGNIRIF